MKFKVGDKVKIKSLGWYNKNKDKNGYVYGHYPLIPFDPERAKYCGQEYEVVYADKIDNTYQLDCGEEDIRTFWWTEEMIEKIETQPLFTLTAEEVEEIRQTIAYALDKRTDWIIANAHKLDDYERSVLERLNDRDQKNLKKIYSYQET